MLHRPAMPLPGSLAQSQSTNALHGDRNNEPERSGDRQHGTEPQRPWTVADLHHGLARWHAQQTKRLV